MYMMFNHREPEFQRFFAAHDRGDGKIDVRSLLVKLMHNQQMGEINGLVSKDPEQLRREVLMTKSMVCVFANCVYACSVCYLSICLSVAGCACFF